MYQHVISVSPFFLSIAVQCNLNHHVSAKCCFGRMPSNGGFSEDDRCAYLDANNEWSQASFNTLIHPNVLWLHAVLYIHWNFMDFMGTHAKHTRKSYLVLPEFINAQCN